MERTFCLILMVLVYGQATAQNNGDIRLVKGISANSGRLEIYLNHEWGTVCYNKISHGAAQTACKQLGYSDYEQVDTVTNMGIPSGTGTILLSNVNCGYNSENQHILRCTYSRPAVGSCNHSEDMAITCSSSTISPYDTAVRLVKSGTYTSSGTVEVYLNNEWGTICDYEITGNEADTICRQLGYTNAFSHSSTPSSSTRVWLGSVDCVISQPCLDLCFAYPSATNAPYCSSVATVSCTFNTTKDDIFTPGSETLCTSYVTIEKHLVAIIVGALVAFLCICLLFVLIPIIYCCCCIPGCILHSCRERRVVYQVIQ